MKINNPDYIVTIHQTPDPKNPGAGGVTIIAPLPENLAYDTSSEYATPFAQGMLSGGAWMQAAASAGLRLTTQAMTAQLWQGSTENELSLDLEFQTDSDPDKDVRQPVLALMKLAAASVDPATGLLKSPGPKISLEDTGMLLKNSLSQLEASGRQIGGALGDVFGIPNTLRTDKTLNNETANLNSNQKSNTKPPVENGLGGAQFWKKRIRDQISIQIGRYAFFDSVVILNVQETWSHEMDSLTGLPLHCKVSVRFKPLFLVTQEDLQNIFGGAGGAR